MSGKGERNSSKSKGKGARGGVIAGGPASDDDLAQTIEYILKWCYQEAEKGFGDKELDEDAEEWWFGHYRVYFHYALCVKHRRWEEDGPNVLVAALRLGQYAAKLAGGATKISKENVQTASMKLDCSILPRPALAIWCAP